MASGELEPKRMFGGACPEDSDLGWLEPNRAFGNVLLCKRRLGMA